MKDKPKGAMVQKKKKGAGNGYNSKVGKNNAKANSKAC